MRKASPTSWSAAPRSSTDPFSPYDIDTATQAEWVTLRRDGWTLRAIAEAAGVPPQQVAFSTKGHGPYPNPGAVLPPGVIGVSEVARRLGVTRRTAIRKIDQGLVPQPDFVTRAGRRLWLSSTFPQ